MDEEQLSKSKISKNAQSQSILNEQEKKSHFQPSINKRSQFLNQQRNIKDRHAHLYQISRELKEKKQSMVEEQNESNLMKDLSLCTFTPKINKSYHLPISNQSVEDRLITWKQKKEQKLQKMQKEQQIEAERSLSTRSLKLSQRK